MSSHDPVASAAKGLVKGTLEWTHEKIKELVVKFKNKNLVFIEDTETIDLVKKQRETGEWNFFKEYVKDDKLRILFQMGLALRKLEKDKKSIELDNLRRKIFKKHGPKGLHIAQFIQNGFFSKYVGNMLSRATTSHKLKFEIEDLFNDVDKRVVFIQTTH